MKGRRPLAVICLHIGVAPEGATFSPSFSETISPASIRLSSEVARAQSEWCPFYGHGLLFVLCHDARFTKLLIRLMGLSIFYQNLTAQIPCQTEFSLESPQKYIDVTNFVNLIINLVSMDGISLISAASVWDCPTFSLAHVLQIDIQPTH